MADMPASVREDGLVASARGPRADRPKRRTFTPAYKLAIVEQYDQLSDARERGRCCAARACTLPYPAMA